ncbi:MAG: 2OG-Fe(II) oxygenase [Burkholderiaceae bacterium]
MLQAHEGRASVRDSDARLPSAEPDAITIRGTRLVWSELVDRRLFDTDYRLELGEQLRNAVPFQHLVVDGWFHPDLLRLVREEFDLYPFADGRDVDRKYENTYRSPRNPVLGPAGQVYFGLVNSGWFTGFLSAVTQVGELIADPTLHNGGLHESRQGGKFSIHRDFERNTCSGLANEMVLITYLNEHWNPAWNGALELWDANASRCVCEVQPELGRTVLMRNGPSAFHGHSAALAMPEGQVRRSLASYYYSNSPTGQHAKARSSSLYLYLERSDRVKSLARQLTPPIVWAALKRLLR